MVPWKKDAGKKKAEWHRVDTDRQDDGEKEQGMFWVKHQSEPVVLLDPTFLWTSTRGN